MVLLREAIEHSDDALLQECRQGDVSAFDALVRRYKDRVYNVVYRFLGNHEDALDVSQEVFVRAFGALEEFRGASKVYTWLYSIAANLARNRLRDGSRKGRNLGVPLDAAATAAASAHDPRSVAQKHELDALLQQCLNELPEHCRTAFVLRMFDELSYDEIAETLDCPVGTVKSRINQARTLLRARLKDLAVL